MVIHMNSEWFKKALLCLLGLCLCVPGSGAEARENLLKGAVSLENIYDSNVFQTHTGRIDEWQTTVAPELSIQSAGQNDTLTLEFAPELSYNHRRNEQDITHDLTIAGEKALSSHWQISFSDNYTYFDDTEFEADTTLSLAEQFRRADDVTQAEIVRLLFPELAWVPALQLTRVLSELQQRYTASPAVQGQVDSLLSGGGIGARHRYWTNAISLQSIYEFGEKSALTIGYAFEVLDNQTGVQADRYQHSPSLLYTYQFNSQWGAEVGYQFETIHLDSSDDSEGHNPNFRLNFHPSANNLLYVSYDYDAVDYEGVTSDIRTQDATVGWEHDIDSRTSIDSALTNEYMNLETGSDERELNFDMQLRHSFQKGAFTVGGDCAFRESRSRNTWGKLSRTCGVLSRIEYEIAQDVSSSFDVSFDRRSSWDIDATKSIYDDFGLGADLEYAFSRWFSVQFDYKYQLFDTNSVDLEDYSAHLFSIKLIAAKEFWRW